MCSPGEPDWRYVAGRLHIWSLWKDTLVSRGYQYGDYARTVFAKVQCQQYDSRILTYTLDELQAPQSGLTQTGTWTTTMLGQSC